MTQAPETPIPPKVVRRGKRFIALGITAVAAVVGLLLARRRRG